MSESMVLYIHSFESHGFTLPLIVLCKLNFIKTNTCLVVEVD